MFKLLLHILLLAAALFPGAAPEAFAQSTPDGGVPGDSLARTGQLALRPGDLVRITIWREEDLSGEFPVGSDGTVVLPLLGERRVTDVSLTRLRESLLQDYRQQLRNPAIEITALRRINVLGEVNKPGLYEVDPTITLAGAIALAEGATSSGDLERIRVVRDGEVIRQRVGPGSTLQAIDIRSGDQIFVGQRSWFNRNSTFVVSLLLSVTGILIPLLTR